MIHEFFIYPYVCAHCVFHLTCKLQERRYESIFSSYSSILQHIIIMRSFMPMIDFFLCIHVCTHIFEVYNAFTVLYISIQMLKSIEKDKFQI